MALLNRSSAMVFPVLAAPIGFLGGCDGSPPSDKVNAAIKEAVLNSNSQVYRGGEKSGEVTGISIKKWEKSEFMSGQKGGPIGFAATWTARFRAKEPLAYIIVEVDGTKVVEIIADKGAEVPFTGHASATKFDGKWETSAFPDSSFESDAWTPLWNKVGGVTMGYPTISANGQGTMGRGAALQPLSELKPYVIQGSEEEKKLGQMLAERRQKQAEAAQAAAEARRLANEAAQKQREEEYRAQQQKQQEAAEAARKAQQEAYAEQQRVAAEAAKARAEEQRRARLTPMVAPFQNPSGLVMTADAGQTLGSVVLTSTVDPDKFTVTGTGIDLRTMPFREYTFSASADERAGLAFTSANLAAPLAFGVAGANLVCRAAGLTATPLSDADRAKLEAFIAKGRALGSAPAQVIAPEILDAAAAKAKEAAMQTAPMTGVVLYKNRNGPAVLPMFAGDLAANKLYRWGKETISIRLAEPIKGKALYIRAANAPSDNLVVVINGVHRCTVDSIAKLGGAIVPLPEDLEILDIRLDALGTVQARGVMLVK